MAPRRKKPQVAGSRNRITRSATGSALAESRHGQLEMQGRCGPVPHRLCPTESALARRTGQADA
jgi:hypothetical protein